MNKIRIIIGVCLIFIILTVIVIAIKNKDEWFKNHGTITYPSGCIENYENGELVGEECAIDRKLIEEQEKGMYNNKLILVEEANAVFVDSQ